MVRSHKLRGWSQSGCHQARWNRVCQNQSRLCRDVPNSLRVRAHSVGFLSGRPQNKNQILVVPQHTLTCRVLSSSLDDGNSATCGQHTCTQEQKQGLQIQMAPPAVLFAGWPIVIAACSAAVATLLLLVLPPLLFASVRGLFVVAAASQMQHNFNQSLRTALCGPQRRIITNRHLVCMWFW